MKCELYALGMGCYSFLFLTVRPMAFFRKAGNILGRAVSNHINQEISSSKPSIFQAIRYMSSSKLFIGGLSYSTDDASLSEAFNKYGEVAEARVIVDRETGRSRGFGFVTYSSVEEASAAIQALDQQELHGRRIRVDYANDRTRGFGGGGFRGGNFGGGGGYNSGGFGGAMVVVVITIAITMGVEDMVAVQISTLGSIVMEADRDLKAVAIMQAILVMIVGI
ncbi:UNVERIFIED_CONTAM: Glycine-rich RNA-binding protein 3, mitochondrial [Sesamum radiatum]|uniref:Glycine-rich RNA-binding protein 3, mitochondrial n=1 Tax=Sesamum radiatum TaxID=300843 RepID=A0AAW2WLG5_SESRA